MGMDWQKILMAAGGAVGVGAVLYFLLREDPEAEAQLLREVAVAQAKANGGGSAPVEGQNLAEILREMTSAQEQMKTSMKALSNDMVASPLPFEKLYLRVQEAQPQDPLEKRGLSMADLERMLMANQSDPTVMELMAKVMGGTDPSTAGGPTEKAKQISVEKITEIHVFMLERLTKFFAEFKARPDKAMFDMKTVAVSSQALLDSEVMAKFSYASEDIEGAIFLNRSKLTTHMAFLETHRQIQQAMEQFMSSPP